LTRERYRLLPHTADLRVEVRGFDFPSVCAASVEALFSLLTDRRRVRRGERRILTASGGSEEDRLLAILRDALLLLSADRFLVRDAGATMDREKIAVTLHGETIDPARHALYREIKAVTGHGLAVLGGPSGVTARFILDV
jgi:SHS2 domain-containing protein